MNNFVDIYSASWTCVSKESSLSFVYFLDFDQTLVAVSEVSKEINRDNPDFFPIKPMEYDRFLVLSLGTGTAKSEGKYDADEAAKWGILGWLTSGHCTPLVDVSTQASGDMVDFHLCTVFQALKSEENYLRIQVYIMPTCFSIQPNYTNSLFGKKRMQGRRREVWWMDINDNLTLYGKRFYGGEGEYPSKILPFQNITINTLINSI